MLNGIRPPVFFAPAVDSSDKGVMEAGGGSNVPGITGQGACAETACVVDEISDDYFNDLKGKPGGRGWACRRGPWGDIPSLDSGQSSMPNPLDEQLDRCGSNHG